MIYPAALTVSMNYAIQYAFFPGILLRNKISFFQDFSWFVIAVITGQNLSDTCGRLLARIKVLKPPKRLYIILNFVR